MYSSQLLQFLQSVRRDYPCGVPEVCSRTPKVAFIALRALENGEKRLLHDAAVLGLRLQVGEFVILEAEAGELPTLPEGLKVAVLLKDRVESQGSWGLMGGVPCLATFDVASVLGNAGTKKLFWAHLKTVVPRVT